MFRYSHKQTGARLAVLLFFGATGALSDAAYAQEATLKSMVVTATRNPIEEFKAPVDIGVITREQIEEAHYSDIGTALKDMPGLTVQNYGSNGGTYTSNTIMINGSDRIVVLIDGMRANVNGSSLQRFSAAELVDMNQIERIEVLRGSASTLYGSDAQGGVVNIITRKAPEGGETATSLGYATGSYHLGKYNLSHFGSNAAGFYWGISAQKRNSGDFKDGSGFTMPESIDDKTWGVKLGKRFDDGTSFIELQHTRYLSDYMRPSNVSKRDFRQAYGKKDNSRLALNYLQKITDNLSNRFLIYRNTNYLKDSWNIPGSQWLMDLETDGVSDQITYRIGQHLITGGFDYYTDKVKDYGSMYSSYSGKSMTSKAVFVQDEWSFAKDWTLTPGIRFDHHSTAGSHTSPALSINYVSNARTNYYATIKEYFVAPNQSYVFTGYGNPNLKPESGRTAEIGVKHQFSSTMNGTFNVYTRRSEDVIAFVNDGSTYVGGTYRNVGNEKALGLNAMLNAQFLKNFSATVGYVYTHINAQRGQNINRDGSVPVHAWNMRLGYENDKFSANLFVRGLEGRKYRRADPYKGSRATSVWIADLAVNYEAYKGLTLYAKLNNLFDKHYTDRTYNADPAIWYTQPGRNFVAGMKYTF